MRSGGSVGPDRSLTINCPGCRTWRRLETQGKASIEDLIKATLALRCEEALTALFAEPVAASLDDLLKRQVLADPGMKTGRIRAKAKPKAP